MGARLALRIVIVLFVIFFAALSWQKFNKSNLDGPYRTLDGQQVVLRELGKPQVIVFWATWCSFCRRDIPSLIKLYEQHRSKGLTVIAITAEGNYEKVERFVADNRISYPVLSLDPKTAGDIRYRLEGRQGNAIPFMVTIDQKGEIVERIAGSRPFAQMQAMFARIL